MIINFRTHNKPYASVSVDNMIDAKSIVDLALYYAHESGQPISWSIGDPMEEWETRSAIIEMTRKGGALC
jgi:hypothetical protein